MATVVLASLAFGGVQAAVSSTHTSENKIDFTAEGWHLSAKMSEFKSGNKVLRGATLAFKDGVVKAGSSSNISVAPTKSDVLFDNTDSKPFMNAMDKGGRGTWVTVWSGTDQANEAVQLNVVAGTPEANTEYTSSITWELADAPK